MEIAIIGVRFSMENLTPLLFGQYLRFVTNLMNGVINLVKSFSTGADDL
jgi:hypothetical protein